MRKVKGEVFKKSQLWSGAGGRDYIKVDDEVYSINGLYCDEDGNINRWGHFVTVTDIRWPVLVHRQYDGKLEFQGDMHDVQVLDHWGYTWPSMDEVDKYKRVPGGEDRTKVTPAKEPSIPEINSPDYPFAKKIVARVGDPPELHLECGHVIFSVIDYVGDYIPCSNCINDELDRLKRKGLA